MELRHSTSFFSSPMLGSYSLPSLAEGSEAISEAEEIHEVKSLQAKGNKAAKAKEFAEALKYFREALDIDQHNVGVLHDRSLVLLQMGRYKDAQMDAEAVILIGSGDSQGYFVLGLCLQQLKENTDALKSFLLALDHDIENADKITNHIALVAARLCDMPEEFTKSLKEMDAYKKLSEVGVCLFQKKKYVLCIQILEAAQKFQTNQKGITMKILLTMANAHTSLKHQDQAIPLYLECLSLAEATHDHLYQTKSLVNVATLYLEDGDTHLAIVYYVKLLHLKAELLTEVGSCENLPDFWTNELQCGLHLNLSIAYKSIGNMKAAVHHAKEYNSFMKEFGVTGQMLAESHHNTGMLNEILGNYKEALQQYQLYLNLSKKNGNKKGMAQAYGCMGTVYAALRNWTLSITYHEQYINMATKSGDKRMLAIANEIMADSYMVKGDYDLAVKHLEAMVNACARTDCRTKATGLCKLGNAYRAQLKKQYSLYFYERACDLARDYGYMDIQTMSEFNIACIQQASTQMQDIEQAQKYFQKLIPFYETKIKEHVEEDTHCPGEYYDQLLQCYDGIQSVLSKLGNKEESLMYAEAFRKRCVTQLSNFQSTTGHIIPGIAGQWDVWTIERMNRVVSQQNGTVLYYTLLDTSLLLWVLQPGLGLVRFYTGRQGGKDTSMREQIQGLIDEMLSDFDTKRLLDECENRALPLPDADLKHIQKKNLNLAKKKYTTNAESKTENDDSLSSPKKSAQRQLYNMLFAPVEDILSKLDTMSHLLIIPDKELCHCPFGILQDWNSKYVMDRFRITFLPCLLLLERVQRSEQALLRCQDQLEFDRSMARKGGINKVSAEQKREGLFSEMLTPSDLSLSSLEKVNLKHVSNPRLFTSGVLKSPRKSKSPRLSLSREATFHSQVSRGTSNKGHMIPESASPSQRFGPCIGRPVSPEQMMGTHTYSTLTTRTSTGTDITTSTNMITLYQQISDKSRCVVYGAPSIQDKVQLNGKLWQPNCDLVSAEQESQRVATFLDVQPLVGIDATKDSLLSDLQQATVIHIATYGCWTENKLALTPNKIKLEEGAASEKTYIVCPEDINNLKMCAQLVVLNCGYNPWRREYIHSYSLPASFLAAGVQCVMVCQWQVPDAAMDKFYHHFYMALQDGCLLTDATKEGMEALRQDDRFCHIYNWSPFILIGKDTEINISSIRHAMLDQKLDQSEAEIQAETGQDYLNPRNVVTHVPAKEENFTNLQFHLRDILRHHHRQTYVIPGLIDLLDAALKRLHTEDNNKQTSHLPADVANGKGSLGLLKMLGYHFQAMGASLTEPYVVYPHWNTDEMLIPAYDAIRALTDIVGNAGCSQALCDILPLSQDHISLMVDLMSITKHASEIQLKVTDLSVRPLWQNTKIKKLLTAAGFHQIGLLLNFNKVPDNRQLLTALLQLLLAISCHKSQVLLYRLDVNLLGRSPSVSKQALYSNMDQIKLPSLTPLILPRNQLRISTPWHSTVEREEEMVEKMRLARGKSNLDEEFQDYLERAKTWHQMTVTAQANESLDRVGRPKTTPTKVKVIAGGSSSRERIPVNKEDLLMIQEVDQRRDYAHFVLQQRVNNIGMRHKDEVMKLYLPYIQS